MLHTDVWFSKLIYLEGQVTCVVTIALKKIGTSCFLLYAFTDIFKKEIYLGNE